MTASFDAFLDKFLFGRLLEADAEYRASIDAAEHLQDIGKEATDRAKRAKQIAKKNKDVRNMFKQTTLTKGLKEDKAVPTDDDEFNKKVQAIATKSLLNASKGTVKKRSLTNT